MKNALVIAILLTIFLVGGGCKNSSPAYITSPSLEETKKNSTPNLSLSSNETAFATTSAKTFSNTQSDITFEFPATWMYEEFTKVHVIPIL